MENQINDTLNSFSEPIRVRIVEAIDKTDWNAWFLLVGVLSLIAAVLVPFLQKKYEENKSKYGFHLYVKKKIGIVWNLLTYDKIEYKHFKNAEVVDNLHLTLDEFIRRFETDYREHNDTIHPLFAFGVLLNLQNFLFTITRVRYALRAIDLNNLDEKTIAFGDKLSKKEHHKLTAVFMLIEHYISITTFHDKFDSLKSIKREIKDSHWIGLKVENTVLKEQGVILDDLKYVKENEASLVEIINTNKLLIQELKSYFNFHKQQNKRP